MPGHAALWIDRSLSFGYNTEHDATFESPFLIAGMWPLVPTPTLSAIPTMGHVIVLGLCTCCVGGPMF